MRYNHGLMIMVIIVVMPLLMVVLMGNVFPGVGVADDSGFTVGVGAWWCWCV